MDRELLTATYLGNIERCKYLLDHQANINAKDEYGWTPLHYASSYNYTKICKLLLDYGADVHAMNRAAKTPFDIANDKKNKETSKLLSDYLDIIFYRRSDLLSLAIAED